MQITELANKNFGIKYLYPWQRMVISNILEAYDFNKNYKDLNEEEKNFFLAQGNDSFCLGRQIVLLPTGAGKSLCFQLPALLLDGPTMIIYPLLALMTDQERRMQEGCLKCVTFRGGQSKKEQQENLIKIKNGAQIILANPEILQNESLIKQLKTVNIKHIVIDEAHCVSEWGDSFRPAYLNLGKVIQELNPTIVTAFTATASEKILLRIKEILFNNIAHVVQSNSDRPNIHYYVHYSSNKKKEVLLLSHSESKPMIIFCGTRNKAEDMAQEINTCYGSEISKFYHAGLEKSEKEECEKWFYSSKNGILCATCAYGMGVDKKDIHTVVHLEPSSTVESYIQEAGRGGRDGSIAKAILLWSIDDSINYGSFDLSSREYSIKKFAETTECRRQVLLDALNAEQAYCHGCDNCLKESHNADFKNAIKIIKKHNRTYTQDELSQELYNYFNAESLKNMGVKIWSHNDVLEVIKQLKKANYIYVGKWLWKGRFMLQKNYSLSALSF